MITFFDLLVVAVILGCAYWGWLVGIEAASAAALELLACVSVAVMAHESVAGLLHAGFTLVLGDWIGTAWSILLAFTGLAWGLFALVRFLFHQRHASGEKDHGHTEIDPLADRVAGAVAGGVGGVVLGGSLLVTLSMIPFLAGFKPSGDRMLLDVGKAVLRASGQFAIERYEGRSLPLWGEPPSQASVSTALLTSEPYVDVDGDGSYSEADRFRDVDGNGTFTTDLYFTDVDADGLRRIGMVDKYAAGRWDGSLISNDRPRPKPKQPPVQPAPKPSKPKPSPAATPAASPATEPNDPAVKPADSPAEGRQAGDDF